MVAKAAWRRIRLRCVVLIPINVTVLAVFVCACSICSLTTPKHPPPILMGDRKMWRWWMGPQSGNLRKTSVSVCTPPAPSMIWWSISWVGRKLHSETAGLSVYRHTSSVSYTKLGKLFHTNTITFQPFLFARRVKMRLCPMRGSLIICLSKTLMLLLSSSYLDVVVHSMPTEIPCQSCIVCWGRPSNERTGEEQDGGNGQEEGEKITFAFSAVVEWWNMETAN